MRDASGIDLHPDVLPLSNLAACLPPFLLRPDRGSRSLTLIASADPARAPAFDGATGLAGE